MHSKTKKEHLDKPRRDCDVEDHHKGYQAGATGKPYNVNHGYWWCRGWEAAKATIEKKLKREAANRKKPRDQLR